MDHLAAVLFGAFITILLLKIVGMPEWLQKWLDLVPR